MHELSIASSNDKCRPWELFSASLARIGTILVDAPGKVAQT